MKKFRKIQFEMYTFYVYGSVVGCKEETEENIFVKFIDSYCSQYNEIYEVFIRSAQHYYRWSKDENGYFSTPHFTRIKNLEIKNKLKVNNFNSKLEDMLNE